jgi:hypothetical protein
MSSSRTAIFEPSVASAPAGQDHINLSSAVIGEDLILGRLPQGGVELHTLEGGRTRRLGEFASVADAWRAIDVLDLADTLAVAA